MLLSEITSVLTEEFDLNDSRASNTFGELLKLDPVLDKAFKKVALDLNMDGATYNKFKALELLHPEAFFKRNGDYLSNSSYAALFAQQDIAVLVYFETYIAAEDDDIIFRNDIMHNDAPIYIKFVPKDVDDGLTDRYLLSKHGDKLKPIMVDGVPSTALNKMKTNLETYYRILANNGPVDAFSQFRTWAIFK